MSITRKTYSAAITKATAPNTYSITASTNTRDRDGDIVEPLGIDVSRFKANPVLLWSHRYDEPPIGKVTSLRADATSLVAEFTFATGDEFAARVENLVKQNVVRASSIGFLPGRYEMLDDGRGRRYVTSELLELSLVAVPANAECVRAIKQLSRDFPTRVDPVDDGIVVLADPSDDKQIAVSANLSNREILDAIKVGIRAVVRAEVNRWAERKFGTLPN